MLVLVTGMKREAKLIGGGNRVVVAGGDSTALAGKIEAATEGARALLSIGIGGGLAPGLAVGTIVIATELVWRGEHLPADAAWRVALAKRLPRAASGPIAGSNTIVATPAAKSALHGETGALLSDMESHVAARVAAGRNLPFAALRVVSDDATHTLPPAAFVAIGPDGDLKLSAVLRSIAAKPAQIPALIRTARNTDRAMTELRRCSDLLGNAFACPYLA
jgi:adenosylhomocysteine nucleosidase